MAAVRTLTLDLRPWTLDFRAFGFWQCVLRLEEPMAQDASAVDAGSRATGTEMTRQQVVTMFERRQKAFEDLDAEGLARDYAEECVVESPMGGVQHGRAAAQTVIRAWFDAFVDLKTRVDSLLIDG